MITGTSQWLHTHHDDHRHVTMIARTSQWLQAHHNDSKDITMTTGTSQWSPAHHNDYRHITMITSTSQWSPAHHNDYRHITRARIVWSRHTISSRASHCKQINYRKTSNIIRTFLPQNCFKSQRCVLYIGLDIFCSLFQIETIIENETARLQRRWWRRRMSIRVTGEWASWLWTVAAKTVAAAGGGRRGGKGPGSTRSVVPSVAYS